MIVENLSIQDLPFVMFSDRKKLPDVPCVYLALDKSGQILYIGRSINASQRWSSHHKYHALKNLDGIKISYLEMEESLLFSVERALIAWFKPPLNEADKHTPRGFEALRRAKGLTQSQLAEAVGVDVSTIRNWEKNRDGGKMFRRVAKVCEVMQCNSPLELCEDEMLI
jgi:DNA-binding XRE family transcriptional regulator